MSKKSLVYAVLVCFAVASVAGCSSAQKKRDEEMKGVKTKVETLETKVEGIETKQSDAEKTMAAKDAEAQSGANFGVKERPGKSAADIKDIQTAFIY